MGNTFIQDIRAKAAKKRLKVAFPDAEDVRTLRAALILREKGIAEPLLVGPAAAICKVAADNGLDLGAVAVVDPATDAAKAELAGLLHEKRKAKGLTPEQAAELAKGALYYAGLMLASGRVGAVVGGNISATGDVIRAAIHTVGTAPGISTVSSYFIMVFPDRLLCYADCAVLPNPTDAQLADIAVTSAKNFQAVTGEEPRVAMLSFSTKGSAQHADVDKVVSATAMAREKAPHLLLDGEMQADAALVPSVGERKCKGSPVAGKANVLIFPDLDAANISYKLTERLAGAEAVGPIVQGLNKPYCDLSRGCSVDDMVNVAAICSLMA
ncbi:MAG TPA: phosphate acetyltransferase [Candidatus Aminicenantes bacterium]|nr:phosphate acetyltransferase [Candidatus Aminicenantes bacterium]